MPIQIYHFSGHTMGDSLMAMSLWCSLKEPVELHTNINSLYSKWKSILDISDDRIKITEHEFLNNQLGQHPAWLEGFKIFSRYVETENINVFGQKFKVGKRNKPCAAIVVNDGSSIKDQKFFDKVEFSLDSRNPPEYPYNKYFKKETYDFINNLVLSAGYDPIIIDSKQISLEHKAFVLNELCEFVIGYEGGIMHFAHILKIPTFILPWRLSNTLSEAWLHLDKKTYMIEGVEELYSWTPERLNLLLQELHNDNGKNFWINHPTFPSTEPLLEFLKDSHQGFHDQESWAREHIINPTLGGF